MEKYRTSICGQVPRKRMNPKAMAEYTVRSCVDQIGLEKRFIDKDIGFGVFSARAFKRGDFLLEYRGMLTNDIFSVGHPETYIYEFEHNQKAMCLDATYDDGSLGRLVNDEYKNPNSKMKKLVIDGKPHLCLFAMSDIAENTEIRYSYGESMIQYPWRQIDMKKTSSVNSNTTEYATPIEAAQDVPSSLTVDAEDMPSSLPTADAEDILSSLTADTEDIQSSLTADIEDIPSSLKPDPEDIPDAEDILSNLTADIEDIPSSLKRDPEDIPDAEDILSSLTADIEDIPSSLKPDPEDIPDTEDILSSLAADTEDIPSSLTADVISVNATLTELKRCMVVLENVSQINTKKTTAVNRNKTENATSIEAAQDVQSSLTVVAEGTYLRSSSLMADAEHRAYSPTADVISWNKKSELQLNMDVIDIEMVAGSVDESSQEIPLLIQNTVLNPEVLLVKKKTRRQHRQRLEASSTSKVTVAEAFGESGKRIRNKFPCNFCDKQILHYPRHIRESHSDEVSVYSLLMKPKKERLQALQKLRFESTFNYNCDVLTADEGVLIVRRRSRVAREPKDYLPCSHCYAFYAVEDLWRHARKCPHRVAPSVDDLYDTVHIQRAINAGQMLVDGARMGQHNLQSEYRADVLARMSRDDITEIVKSDNLILQFGAVLYRKLGKYRVKDIVQRMRQMGRLLKVLNTGRNAPLRLTDCLDGIYFDEVLHGAETLCEPQAKHHGVNSFGTPYIGLALGYSLLKCAHLKKGQSIRRQNIEMGEQADRFIALHDSEWTDTISSRCLVSYRMRRMTSVKALPLTGDLVKLDQFLTACIKSTMQKVKESYSYMDWRNLLEAVLCSLTVFNKRRGGEMSRVQLKTYTERPSWAEGNNTEIVEGLSAMEKQLLNRVDLMQMPGKRIRTVPVLILPHVKKAMDVLVEAREQNKLFSDNPYFFATTPTDGYLDGCKIMQKMASLAKLEAKHLVTSTNLRKYVATVAQVISLTSGELEWLCNHLGHEVEIDRNFYRQHPGVIEITKMSKLLMAVNTGQLSKYHGKKLDDIDCEELEVDEDVDEDVGSSDEQPLTDVRRDLARRVEALKPKQQPPVRKKWANAISDDDGSESDSPGICNIKKSIVKSHGIRSGRKRIVKTLDNSSESEADGPRRKHKKLAVISGSKSAGEFNKKKSTSKTGCSQDVGDINQQSNIKSKKLAMVLHTKAKHTKARNIDVEGSSSDSCSSEQEELIHGDSDVNWEDESFGHSGGGGGGRRKFKSGRKSIKSFGDGKKCKEFLLPKRSEPGKRVKWSDKELKIIKFHFKTCFQLGKPPSYASVEAIQNKFPELKARTRDQIKTRVWYMVQTGR